MHYNEGVPSPIIPLMPQGTNSTLFTACCGTAICDNQRRCPSCQREVVGYNTPTDAERGLIRWKNATRHWKRKEPTK